MNTLHLKVAGALALAAAAVATGCTIVAPGNPDGGNKIMPLPIPIRPGDGPQRIVVRNSASPMAPGGGLELVVSARPIDTAGIDATPHELATGGSKNPLASSRYGRQPILREMSGSSPPGERCISRDLAPPRR